MSERLNQRAVTVLRTDMYPKLPPDIQALIPKLNDPYLGPGPNIFVGPMQERGVTPALPCVAVWSEFVAEALTGSKYIHATLYVDCWCSASDGGNVDGRRVVGILGEYVGRALQDNNWTGDGISIKRCYDINTSGVVFESAEKLHHILQTYRVEAGSADGFWY